MKICSVILVFVFGSLSINAQHVIPQKLKVFIDCSNTRCDMTFIRTEINVVDFLLDRLAADVHVLITSLNNGSGGSQYQIIFYGQNYFKQVKDTLKFTTGPNATDFERRDYVIKYLKLGLAPLVAKTAQADGIHIVMKSEHATDSARELHQTRDNWNYWVFRLGGNGNVNIDQNYKSSEFRGNLRFDRTTDKWKVKFGFLGGRVNSSTVTNSDSGNNVVVRNKNYSFEHSLVKSKDQHWSYGYSMSYLNDTFSNYQSKIYFFPQIEYSFFRYKDVNNRYLTFRYGVGPQNNNYYESTIYNKTNEFLWGQFAELNIALNQKWGTISTGVRYSNYFHDWTINNFALATQMEVRITGGLSIYTFFSGSLVHDQIYLPGDKASGEEVLSRKRQLPSSYNFQSYFGINYRFGTKLNNFVNPRFNSAFDDFRNN